MGTTGPLRQYYPDKSGDLVRRSSGVTVPVRETLKSESFGGRTTQKTCVFSSPKALSPFRKLDCLA